MVTLQQVSSCIKRSFQRYIRQSPLQTRQRSVRSGQINLNDLRTGNKEIDDRITILLQGVSVGERIRAANDLENTCQEVRRILGNEGVEAFSQALNQIILNEKEAPELRAMLLRQEFEFNDNTWSFILQSYKEPLPSPVQRAVIDLMDHENAALKVSAACVVALAVGPEDSNYFGDVPASVPRKAVNILLEHAATRSHYRSYIYRALMEAVHNLSKIDKALTRNVGNLLQNTLVDPDVELRSLVGDFLFHRWDFEMHADAMQYMVSLHLLYSEISEGRSLVGRDPLIRTLYEHTSQENKRLIMDLLIEASDGVHMEAAHEALVQIALHTAEGLEMLIKGLGSVQGEQFYLTLSATSMLLTAATETEVEKFKLVDPTLGERNRKRLDTAIAFQINRIFQNMGHDGLDAIFMLAEDYDLQVTLAMLQRFETPS